MNRYAVLCMALAVLLSGCATQRDIEHHDLDDDYYKVKHCPFCGTKVTEEEDLSWGDWEEDE